jgi:hypothetical protein
MNVDIRRPLAAAHAAAKRKGGKVVHLEEISGYLHADPARVAIALQHLAAARGAVETSPGQWILISPMPTPAIKRGKVLTMPRHERNAELTATAYKAAATTIDGQTDAYRREDAGDDGRVPS